MIFLIIFLILLQGLKLKKQRSTGDLDRKGVNPVTSIRSTGSNTSWMSSESGFTTGGQSMMSEGSNQSFALEVRLLFFVMEILYRSCIDQLKVWLHIGNL